MLSAAQKSTFRGVAFTSSSRSSTRRRSSMLVSASTTKVAPADLLAVAKRAADAGAAIILEAVDKPRTGITYKGATDLVTDTDKASEAAILDIISAAFPDHAVLGEEGGVSGNTSSDYLWCVDPLDGTTNFTHGYPSFAVSIACLRHSTPVAATVIGKRFTGKQFKFNILTYE